MPKKRATRKPAKKTAKPVAKTASVASHSEPETLDLWVDDGLSAAEERFVNELCADPERVGVRAAMRAYPKQGYDTARVTASRFLNEPKIIKAIRRRLAPAIRRSRTSIEEVTKRIGDGMHWDISDVLDEHGAYRPLSEWPAEVRAQIAGIKTEELKLAKDGPVVGRIVDIKFLARTDYVTLGARMNRMLTDKLEHDIGETLEQVLTKMAKAKAS